MRRLKAKLAYFSRVARFVEMIFFARCYTRQGSLGLASFCVMLFYVVPAKKNDPRDFIILFSSI